MDLQTLLKKYLEEEKVIEFLEEMKTNKIFTASQENLDVRYKKSQDEKTAKEKELAEALSLIEELKQTNQGNEDLQTKVSDYEKRMEELQEENENLKIENAVKVRLLGAKAKPAHIKFLMFQMKEDSDKKLELDENGELKDFDSVLEGLKTNYPDNFETVSKREVEELKLPENSGSKSTITKEQFDKMSYKDKMDLFNKDPETYNNLKNI